MKDTKAKIDVAMDPVSVALNLWASQIVHSDQGGEGYVSFKDVFPGIALDDDWTIKTDPPMPEEGSEKTAPQQDRSDSTFDASPGKYGSSPKWDWTTLSACECVEWCITVCGMDPRYVRSVLFAVHPDTGRMAPVDYPRDPFLALADAVMGGARFSAKKGYANAARSAYGEFRRWMWMAVGEQTRQDALGKELDRTKYLDTRRHLNKLDAQELSNLRTG